MAPRHIQHGSQRRHTRIRNAIIVILVVALLAVGLTATGLWWKANNHFPMSSASATTQAPAVIRRSKAPKVSSSPSSNPAADTPETKAAKAVNAMPLNAQVGQLVMAPLFAGSDPSSLHDFVASQHVGSVLIIGNWNTGTAGVKQVTDALQSYTPQGNKLIVATDQEGGQVQHVRGPGFDAMPSGVEQGQLSPDQLTSSASQWGRQLKSAGINVDLAPVTDTVQTNRAGNAPIGALDRDFGLDAPGNAQHAAAFINGMRQAGVEATIKHYPGLGAVSGNTDFTANGILDTTTTLDGNEIGAFTTALQANPGMVMMSLATYQAIDPANPAAFSSALIDGHLRAQSGYKGVVTSDSLSATAVSGIAPNQLGVRFVEAGGDLACIGANQYVQPILDGLNQRAANDPAFAQKVKQSATRVMTLKYRMGLAQ
ncbi:MAG: beta-glucosidase [Bifidobacterium tibiigranuli]|jgi:beta-N-acetylhexosaminidase|uniref:glycoside hydrolase family 3 N-terminal domain-containing protein n=1 Tax=Bifidobacterium tibiigranuli TaxID=2172043 RepID=UPI0026EA2ADA|nr:glycoside hydrolase family 3 N-terminal domain-containing protein [Bifidobacterium tibiigranuli]MCI1673827.1 beta-glucosidase [Bifidobacterium tibiigranuli]MCI1712076.1 beta-glucosidase [Bifidobacterium tibiigranuli]MCI1833865.1 beta-glucosidase [Bifidobacterium tibiigranuli]